MADVTPATLGDKIGAAQARYLRSPLQAGALTPSKDDLRETAELLEAAAKDARSLIGSK